MKRSFGFIWAIALFFIILGVCEVAFAGEGVSRSLLKTGGLLGALLGIVGISVAGYLAGKDQERADEARAAGDRDPVDLHETTAEGQRVLHHRDDARDVLPRRDLWHDPAKGGVGGNL